MCSITCYCLVSKNNDQPTQGSSDSVSKEGKKTKNKRKTKKETRSSSSLDGLVLGPATSPASTRINQSFSDVDYLPMMPRNVLESSKTASDDASRSREHVYQRLYLI